MKNDQTFSEMHTLAVYRVEKVREEMAEMHKNVIPSVRSRVPLCYAASGLADRRHKISAAKDVAFN